MKHGKIRLLAALLVFACLLSLFPLSAAAEGEGEEEEAEPIDLLINRTFDEGWPMTNGLSGGASQYKENLFELDYETNDLGEYNYFLRMTQMNSSDGYLQATLGAYSGYLTIEYSVKIDDPASLGRTVYVRLPGGGSAGAFNIVTINNNKLGALGNTFDVPFVNEWVDLGFVFNFDVEPNTCDTYVNGEKLYTNQLDPAIFGLDIIRIGLTSGVTEAHWGESWCLDNLKIYKGYNGLADLTGLGYGSLVNAGAAKTVEIKHAAGGLSDEAILSKALCMKVGVNNCLLGGEKHEIVEGRESGSPQKIDGKVFVPLEPLLDYMGLPVYVHPDGVSYDVASEEGATYLAIGRSSASVKGERLELTAAPCYLTENGYSYPAVCMDDVDDLFPGYYISYDEMGLIVFAERENLIPRTGDFSAMVKMMKQFIFDLPTGEELYADVKANTNDFTHPYIYTNQARFDELREIYYAEEGDPAYSPELRSYIDRVVKNAESEYKRYAATDAQGTFDTYNGLAKKPVNPRESENNGGYDYAGGRLNESSTECNRLENAAFAYQITRDEKYARFAYDFAIAMGEWPHWGPGHFLNCADATRPYAVSFDWLYNAYKELGLNTDAVADILYTHGVYQGWLSVHKQVNYAGRRQGDASWYVNRANNWTAVCVGGMMIGCLALMDYDAYKDVRDELVTNNLWNLADSGLDFYAPDGSYEESAGYWSYGTNNLFKLCMALNSAAGKTYGFMDTWGLDKTCYFALNSESSDYVQWSYHDGGSGAQDTSLFCFVGAYTGDLGLVSIRQQQIAQGKSIALYDILYYDPSLNGKTVELPLDYHMEGISGFVSRSSWDRGALYTGIMGGNNAVNHGNIDSGNFIVYDKGVIWAEDLSSEDYNVKGSRYSFYRDGGEGQNVVILTSQQASIPYGQMTSAITHFDEVMTNDYGGYAILDTSPAYSKYVNTAQRGLMTTNDRTTTVVQDEIFFSGVQSIAWVMQTKQQITLSDDGRTAYLYNSSKGEYYRVSIVSPRSDFFFRVTDAYTYLLDTTYKPGDSLAAGGVDEYSRNGIHRLVIETTGLSFECAVVFESVDGMDDKRQVGYSYVKMSEWEPTLNPKGNVPIEEDEPDAREYLISDVRDYGREAGRYVSSDYAYTTRFADFFACMHIVDRTLQIFNIESYRGVTEVYAAYEAYLGYLETFNGFRDKVNETAKANRELLDALSGYMD